MKLLVSECESLSSKRRVDVPKPPTTTGKHPVTPPSTSPSTKSVSPLKPSELPPPPRRRQPSNENAVASSSTQNNKRTESSPKKVINTGLLTPCTSQASSGSSSTSFLGLNPEPSAEKRVKAALYEASRRQNGPARQRKPRRRHIFEERVRSST